jgi:formylglycine-generating enzyme required for sulfatase activity
MVRWQPRRVVLCGFFVAGSLICSPALQAAEKKPVPTEVKDAVAKTEAEMQAYTDQIPGTEVKFEMLPIKGGKFLMGSPAHEPHRNADEGPQHEVQISPFWMEKCELTWDEYEVFMFVLDVQRREFQKIPAQPNDVFADLVARPTKPYTDMSFGMGKRATPALSMTHFAARMYCKWLSEKTGRYYRLPTEAEWEYACRAGTTTAYYFGDDPSKLAENGWYEKNSDEKYHKVGAKLANPWGLHDMAGNVSEWVFDQYEADAYQKQQGAQAINPVVRPEKEYPHVVRGGAWDDEAAACRSACRRFSSPDWKDQDPQSPKSVWYLTDAQFVGFRIVRPWHEPTAEEKAQLWEYGLDKVQLKASNPTGKTASKSPN